MLMGTVANAVGIVSGCVAGILLGKWVPEKMSHAITMGLALCVLYIGIDGVLAGEETLVAILSMVIGTITGELLRLDDRIHALGEMIGKRFAGGNGGGKIAEGFVTASLLFCVGAMAVVGSLESGLSGDHATLYAKTMLDTVSALLFAATLGIGVAFSAAAVFVYQGTITLLSSLIAPYLDMATINEMKCVGSIIIIGLSLNMLGLTKMKVMNFVPAIFFPILLCRIL